MKQFADSKKVKLMFMVGSLGTGGAERFVANALTFLPRDKFDLSAAFYRPDRAYDIPDDVLVTVLGKHKPWDNLRACYRFKHWIDQLNPDVIISAWSVPNIFTAETLRWTRCKPVWVARIANNPVKREVGLLGRWAELSYKKADAFISVASALEAPFTKKYPFSQGLITTIRNAVDVDALMSQAQETTESLKLIQNEESDNTTNIISIGRLEHVKRFDILIDAFAILKKTARVKLVILGEGDLREDLERRIREFGLESDILMPGFVANPYAWLGKADVFALASDHEGMSNALLEAQGLGLPAVVTDCPFGMAEIIRDDVTGKLVETGNAAMFAKALQSIIENPAKMSDMGKHAAEHIRRNFSSEGHMKELEYLVSKLVK